MKRVTVPMLLAVFAAACGDGRMPNDIDMPDFRVSDGAHPSTIDGQPANSRFYFLPPLVPTPSFNGVFNAQLQPLVVITGPVSNPDLNDACLAGVEVRRFSGNAIAVDPVGELYSVGYKTDELAVGSVYRICVQANGNGLGYRDIKPVSGGAEVPRNPDQLPILEIKHGSNLPIKFRIEKGTLCALQGNEDCTEAVLGTAGGTAICSGSTCSLEVPQGALQGDQLIFVERVLCNEIDPNDPNPDYLGIDLPQFPGCMRVGSPDGNELIFAEPVIVAACITPSAALDKLKPGQIDKIQMHHKRDDGTVEALPNVNSAIDGDCEALLHNSLAAADGIAGKLWHFASAGWRAVRRAVAPWSAPQIAYAVDRGFGGSTGAMSPFAWALPAQMQKYQWVNPKLVSAGTTVSAQVLVTDAACQGALQPNGSCLAPWSPGEQAVQGARVHFEITQGDGTPTGIVSAMTNAQGLATFNWTIPSPGQHLLDASGFGIGVHPVEGGTGPYAIHVANGPLLNSIVPLGTGHLTFEARVCPAVTAPNGVVGANEYSNSQPFTANLSGGSGQPATLYWRNDCDHLYLAVEVAADEALNNSLVIAFDNTLNGATDEDDQLAYIRNKSGVFVFEDRFLSSGCSRSKQADCGALDTSAGGTTDGAAAHGFANGKFVYELRHPLKSGDARDFQLNFGDPVGMFLALQLGKGAQGNTQWPDFRVYHTINIVQP